MEKALFAYSGDPITFGHIDIIKRAAKLCKNLTVGFGMAPGKNPLFSIDEKIDMAVHSLAKIHNLKFDSYIGDIGNYAYMKGFPAVFRGIRNGKDTDDERNIFDGIRRQGYDIELLPLFAESDLIDVSSTNVKGWAIAQGWIHDFVPLYVKQRIEARLLGQYHFGVTGMIAGGKSTVSDKLRKIGEKKGLPVFDLDLDVIAKSVYAPGDNYEEVRQKIFSTFGNDLRKEDKSVDTKKLGHIVFNDDKKLDELNKIMYRPIMSSLQEQMIYKKGLMMHNAALLAEFGMNYLCNNNVVVVDVDSNEQRRRLQERVDKGYMTQDQLERRINSQFTSKRKREIFENWIIQSNQGKIWDVNTTNQVSESDYENLFNNIVKSLDIYGELRFAALWNRINGDGFYHEPYRKIFSPYMDPRRYWHTWTHIMMGVNAHDNFSQFADNPDAVLASWFCHDIAMTLFSKIDEEKSASVMKAMFSSSGVDKDFCDYSSSLITSGTKHHEIPKDKDARLLTCYDLLFFAQPYEKVLIGDKKMRFEYSQVPDKEFKDARRAILSRFSNPKRRLYPIDEIADLYENTAKDNLNRLIKEKYS
jgi:dephospho-CoA kinase/pantetheine-phosphate adenylyltransferase